MSSTNWPVVPGAVALTPHLPSQDREEDLCMICCGEKPPDETVKAWVPPRGTVSPFAFPVNEVLKHVGAVVHAMLST